MSELEREKAWVCPPLLDAWYLSGPTASGKSHIALELAQRLNAEILSLDSMAVYRGMDIGTAKPSRQEREIVQHHLLDLVPPTESYSVSQYVPLAHEIAEQVRARGKVPLFVGGTPLYLKCLLRGMFLGPAADETFRAAVEADVAEYGIEALRHRLQQVDPLSAHKILPGDVRRMTRALEVAMMTGRPLSHWQSQFERSRDASACRVFVLQWDRAAIHQRVNQRVKTMIEQGLIDEVQHLLNSYPTLSKTALQAVGYREVMQHLRHELSLEQTISEIQAHTRQFVRRQEIWFRSLTEIRRVPMHADRSTSDVVNALCEVATS